MIKRCLFLVISCLSLISAYAYTHEAEKLSLSPGLFTQLDNRKNPEVSVFEDPLVKGVYCYLVASESGKPLPGVNAGNRIYSLALNYLINTSLSVPESIVKGSRDGEEVFQRTVTSPRHRLQVKRYYDMKRQALLYVVTADNFSANGALVDISVVSVAGY
jgi:CreA protein